jgi:hypothetical protein
MTEEVLVVCVHTATIGRLAPSAGARTYQSNMENQQMHVSTQAVWLCGAPDFELLVFPFRVRSSVSLVSPPLGQ